MKHLVESITGIARRMTESELFPWTEAAIGALGLLEAAATVFNPEGTLIKALESSPYSVPGLIKIISEAHIHPAAPDIALSLIAGASLYLILDGLSRLRSQN